MHQPINQLSFDTYQYTYCYALYGTNWEWKTYSISFSMSRTKVQTKAHKLNWPVTTTATQVDTLKTCRLLFSATWTIFLARTMQKQCKTLAVFSKLYLVAIFQFANCLKSLFSSMDLGFWVVLWWPKLKRMLGCYVRK